VLLALALFVSVQGTGRQILDLDAGWEFARVPTPPSIWAGADAVPTSSWRVLSVSSEEKDGENGRATNAFDGNPKTIWHTEWSKRQAPYPHELVVDLGSRVEAVGLRLLPRQTSPNNGRPNAFELFFSNDRHEWGKPVLSDSVPDSIGLYSHGFNPTQGRYMRLVFKTSHKPEPFLSLSEIGLIRKLDLQSQKGWTTQYNIASVQVGGDQFDLKGSALEKAKLSELHAIRTSAWGTATLPHASHIRPLGAADIWQGVTYYRKRLPRPTGSQGKLLVLTIEGAMQSSDLWFNGKHFAERRGGYLPLVVDVTGCVRDQNELLVRVDNRDNPLIPPGKPQQDLDFMYGNGLFRNATLTVSDKLHITDPILENAPRSGGIYVTYPEVNSEHATLRVRSHIRNSGSSAAQFTIQQKLVDDHGTLASSTERSSFLDRQAAEEVVDNLAVSRPILWSPSTPRLYRLVTVLSIHGRTIDRVSTTIGIRRIEVSRQKGMLINGKPIRLIGTNRHQDYPWVGPALSDAANARDALQIRKAGHNIVRLSHYPQSSAFLDECDRIGLLTIPCIPGWQFMNSDPRFVARVAQDIRELIRRDRNHPCAAFWETSLNETYPPVAIAKQWDRVAKSEAVDGSMLTAGDAATGAPWDVAYNQWKDDLSRPQDTSPNKPGYIREYGDYEFGGAYSSSRVTIGQGMDKLLQETWNHVWSDNKFRPQYPWTMGNGTWEMFDTNVPWEFKVSACGLSDLFRRPKPSFWYFASQSAVDPMVKIAATWQPGPAKRDIVVFTNCDEARLSINGRLVAIQRPQKGGATSYGQAKPFDGSNTANLPHPPIVFRSVQFEQGALHVVGFKNGRPVAHDSVESALSPDHLKVWVDDLGVAPTANDLVFIRAAFVDKLGRINPGDHRPIRFEVSGATIAGENFAESEMGVGSILVRTPVRQGKFSIKAFAGKNLQGSCQFLPTSDFR